MSTFVDSGLINVVSSIVVPAPAPTGKYYTDQPYLWQPIATNTIVQRIPGPAGSAPFNLNREMVGPTRDHVCAFNGQVSWAWKNRGGDWLGPPPTLTPQSAVGWSSIASPGGSGLASSAPYTMDVTSLAQYCWTNDRWMALVMQCDSQRMICANLGANPPKITYNYSDGTSEVLDIWLMASFGGSSVPVTSSLQWMLPGCMEFRRPKKPVTSASLYFYIDGHFSGSQPIRVNLLDPPRNTDGVQLGVANNSVLDANLANEPGVQFAVRFMDGWNLQQVVGVNSVNYTSDNVYDPALWGGAPDLSKFPNIGQGKINNVPHDVISPDHRLYQEREDSPHGWSVLSSEWQSVDSTYTGEGFTPIAPGMGALRMKMYKAADIFTGLPLADASHCGSSGSGASGCIIPLPPEEFGYQQEIYTRYYHMIGAPRGLPYVADPAERYNVYQNSGDLTNLTSPQWCDRGGKFGFTPMHISWLGGLSSSAGGPRGWQMRHAWAEVDEMYGGPCEGGWRVGVHTYDFSYAPPNPPGYAMGSQSPQNSGWSQRGGLGSMMYAGKWYCIEMRTKLNSIDQPGVLADGSPHYVDGVQQYWTPDGEIEVWLDGIRVLLNTGLVMRSAPIDTPALWEARTGGTWNPSTQARPTGNLGHRWVWINWFHGGVLRAPTDYVAFYAGLAFGKSYIGPMRLA
jgi:hypothetical protein